MTDYITTEVVVDRAVGEIVIYGSINFQRTRRRPLFTLTPADARRLADELRDVGSAILDSEDLADELDRAANQIDPWRWGDPA